MSVIDRNKIRIEIWKNELTIQSEYLETNDVCVVKVEGEVASYYSVVEQHEDIQSFGILLQKGFWLEHMLVLPHYIGRYLGTKTFEHLQDWCQLSRVSRLNSLCLNKY